MIGTTLLHPVQPPWAFLLPEQFFARFHPTIQFDEAQYDRCHEYSVGIPNPDLIKPENYTLDAALSAQPRNVDIQLDLFLDNANNVKLYPKFQEYFRTAKPTLLAICGKVDPYFIPASAEAFQRDIPGAVVRFLPTGHIALETHLEDVVIAMRGFQLAHAS